MIVSLVAIHESGHCIASMACGGGTPLYLSVIPAGKAGGWCMCNHPKAPMAELIYLAAGDAAEAVIDAWEVSGQVAAVPEITSETIKSENAAVWYAQYCGDVASHGGKDLCDWDAIEMVLAKLVDAGRIKNRPGFVHRWWRRARYIGQRIIVAYLPEAKAIAEALARRGALRGPEIEEILNSKTDPGVPARLPPGRAGLIGL